jgi:eukaryotic-like serine/threonine-protein kinase
MKNLIDHYEIIKSLAQGGMGEVSLAKDQLCGRIVALKCMREKYRNHPEMRRNFFKEAYIAAQLSHPMIIPIYSIQSEGELPYYTMPYVEGETLLQIVKKTQAGEKKGEFSLSTLGSIPSLMHIFWSICQGIAYTHSKGIVHGDLKLENILVGNYDQVLIIDWGIADYLDRQTPSKGTPGTLPYLAPERAFASKIEKTADIYALGVILYSLLTLRPPFQRTNIQRFRKTAALERLLDLSEVAPHRDIPPQLANIAKRCLAFSKEERYQTVEQMLADLQSYREGSPKWMPLSILNVQQPADWSFQENITLAKQLALTHQTDMVEWVNMMISKNGFSGNIRIETKVRFKKEGQGIGFLLALPETTPSCIDNGYLLWIGSHHNPIAQLFHSQVEVLRQDNLELQEEVWHVLKIEKQDLHVRLFLDGKEVLNYLSHIPVSGTYIGLILRDADLSIDSLHLFVSSYSAKVSCLAIGDAFLSNGEYAKALAEYRRIAFSFPGQMEGREALFRAGITLLEEVRTLPRKKKSYSLALDQFTTLHRTPGAPLEYLGKSLVYKALKDPDEESKCLELALRKFPKHPLLGMVREQIFFRLHETSSYDRIAAYYFFLLALRQLPDIFQQENYRQLLHNLEQYREPLPFLRKKNIALELAFWANKPFLIFEMIQKSTEKKEGLYCLLFLKSLSLLPEEEIPYSLRKILSFPHSLFSWEEDFLTLDLPEQHYILEIASLDTRFSDKIQSLNLPPLLKPYQMIAACMQKNFKTVEARLKTLSPENIPNSPYFFIKGSLEAAKGGLHRAIDYFHSQIEEVMPYTFTLLAQWVLGKITLKSPLFFWQKIQLLRQLILFFHCLGDENRVKSYRKQLSLLYTKSK